MSRAPEGGGPVDFRPMEYRAPIAQPTWSVFDRVRSILTSSEEEFILVREGRMGFRGKIGSVPGTIRKRKFLSLSARFKGMSWECTNAR